jgi:hypothetical protein
MGTGFRPFLYNMPARSDKPREGGLIVRAAQIDTPTCSFYYATKGILRVYALKSIYCIYALNGIS